MRYPPDQKAKAKEAIVRAGAPALRTHGFNGIGVDGLAAACLELPAPRAGLDPEWIDWHDLANMRLVAECVIRGALAREESRGAHQRADFPAANDEWTGHQRLRLAPEGLRIDR